ncbi:hypothetical protein [Mucilaginibacter ginsenosidivorans]|uniref:RHS repeat protein n=1 Tax=Mucilaginibacter ginsenosidivorans TaxID=398053 RepID=A0A5B8V057_9SPHI|nr:hypothetical protein [Mucilaginibacter ginsenosidivorans]QEC64642.1 hypothetical protein FRZ54_19390 [Mucilaginibacter ginsenosidivorans]
MVDFFFNPKKPIFLNSYERPEFTCNGTVDSYIYKIWREWPGEDYIQSYVTPNAQYFIKLNEFGKIDFIQVHKDFNSGRIYVKRKGHEKQTREEPVAYYKQFYSGGTSFAYDAYNRIVRHATEKIYRNNLYYSSEANFYYDYDNNMYSTFQGSRQEYDKSGRMLSTTIDDGSEFCYEKRVFKYDEEDRVVKLVEHGYFVDMDDSGNGNFVIDVDKGVQILFDIEYSYNLTEAGEIECVCKTTDLQDNITHKEQIFFNEFGYKRCHRVYDSNDELNIVYYFDFIYDVHLNWVKLTVSTEFKSSGKRNINSIYERAIQYRKGF